MGMDLLKKLSAIIDLSNENLVLEKRNISLELAENSEVEKKCFQRIKGKRDSLGKIGRSAANFKNDDFDTGHVSGKRNTKSCYFQCNAIDVNNHFLNVTTDAPIEYLCLPLFNEGREKGI